MNEHAYFAEISWTWRDRLRFRLMPSGVPAFGPHAADTTKDPFGHGDVVTVKTVVSLSMADRLRVLLTGHLLVETRTITEHIIGQSVTASCAYPIFKPAASPPSEQESTRK